MGDIALFCNLSEDSGSTRMDQEEDCDLQGLSDEGDEPIVSDITKDMFMDRRISATGNTFMNFLDSVSCGKSMVRSSSWSHPRHVKGMHGQQVEYASVNDFHHALVHSAPFENSAHSRRPAERWMSKCPVDDETCEWDDADLSAQSTEIENDARTTLIIRNLGSKISQQELVNLWPAHEEGYDIFYMPFSFKRKKSLGFAFLNFRDHPTALAFKEHWNAEHMRLKSSKPIEIDWAETQGYQAHLDIIQSYPEDIIKCMAFQPIVFHRT
eukprot:gnl/MRDRNA2_/MRDRNA2_86371_c0_seq2.p1 gnl/MRDRNA2_/MRDRNA2_86371_c0~~gnl/MRDRNA2_/MRDRNA2_86371_c0_seq2.p1  ORF type:complete len:268 (-),score=48.38 gnl/MRDRNA2_/MRDRNA2_86371_c0_seq2:299-1102(-)